MIKTQIQKMKLGKIVVILLTGFIVSCSNNSEKN
ncbi:MAG: hypothetical protein ACI8ZX_002208, partial [Planctomycetota bacterium]